ncbi:MAG: 1,2-phenylacetyl-CoA epoxidase subunit PaaC [Saprospiraceae bacterium]
MEDQLKEFILMMADSSMILGQRLGEWCGHGPVLEQDIAITNIALDLIGEARNYYRYLADVEGINEDEYPMKRDVRKFRNVLLTEQPNGNWADTIMRQFIFDCYYYYHLEGMTESSDARLSAIAKKTIKESSYHLSFSGDWVIRLGDGTQESHQKMQAGLENMITYYDELFLPVQYEIFCRSKNICGDFNVIKKNASAKFNSIIHEATLTIPEMYHARKGGKSGLHSEHLGFILADMQFMQRAYPGLTW